MTDEKIYNDIAKRTEGEIYGGIVGPVRTGKSTFIKRFMELFVVPAIEDTYVKERLIDQLPQSGDGRTITTTEPKFIPEEAVRIKVGSTDIAIRLVDCVGYLVPGVLGHEEDGHSRMVKTPWSNEEIPFEEAAEIGTRKVISDHSTVGILVTCDGSFGDIARANYIKTEEKTVAELKALGKPFVIVLNSRQPEQYKTKELGQRLREKYQVPVIIANCKVMEKDIPEKIFEELLKQFPVNEIHIDLPEYMEALKSDHWIKAGLLDTVFSWMESIDTMASVEATIPLLTANENVKSAKVSSYEMATGKVILELTMKEGLYYRILEEMLHHPVSGDKELFLLMQEYAKAKAAYDDLKEAIESVSENGYGIVHPKLHQMKLGKPEVFKQGNKYGVRLEAKAPCLHMIKTDITTEISPIVGSEQQSADLVDYLMAQFSDEEGNIWETNLFGKTLQELIGEQMDGKLTSMPESLQSKVQKSLQKISNEGKDYFICIIL